MDHCRRKNLPVSLMPVLSVAKTPVYAMISSMFRSEPLVTRRAKSVVVPATSLFGRPVTSAVRSFSGSQTSPSSSSSSPASLTAWASAASAAIFAASASSAALSSTL